MLKSVWFLSYEDFLDKPFVLLSSLLHHLLFFFYSIIIISKFYLFVNFICSMYTARGRLCTNIGGSMSSTYTGRRGVRISKSCVYLSSVPFILAPQLGQYDMPYTSSSYLCDSQPHIEHLHLMK